MTVPQSQETELARESARHLQDLVGDPKAFLGDIWKVFPYQYRSEGVRGLLTSERVWGELDCGLLVRPFFRLLGAGAPFDDIHQTRNVVNNPRDGYPVPEAVRVHHEAGSILALERPELWSSEVAALTEGLQRDLRAQTWSTAYLVPADGAILVHRPSSAQEADAHSFVLQLEGSTRWSPGVPSGEGGTPGRAFTGELVPGDVLYLPPGADHTVCAGDSGSLHMVVRVREIDVTQLAEMALALFMRTKAAESVAGNHHTMALDEKVFWLRDALREHLAGQNPKAIVELARRQRGL